VFLEELLHLLLAGTIIKQLKVLRDLVAGRSGPARLPPQRHLTSPFTLGPPGTQFLGDPRRHSTVSVASTNDTGRTREIAKTKPGRVFSFMPRDLLSGARDSLGITMNLWACGLAIAGGADPARDAALRATAVSVSCWRAWDPVGR
jgi:hypothetical protein